MKSEDVVFACTCDIAGKVRGKGFPAADLEKRLKRGIGWAPTNVQITCFDAIAESPFGSLGDMVLIPDADARVVVRDDTLGLSEDFVLGNIRHLDGRAWSCCTRSILEAALERLERAAGLSLVCAFEHEFQFKNTSAKPGSAYTLGGFRERRRFAETLIAAMRVAGIEPDTVMKEYGAEQFEITNAPRVGVRAADEAVILKEVVRAVALATGEEVTFTPLRDPAGVGNGVHIHLSFLDADGNPATHDPQARHGLSRQAGHFIAGVLKYLDSFLALTAPSVISYGRLTPHRWSAAFNNLGVQDREASVRICPVSAMSDIDRARQFNFEFRAADATASPYLQLAAIVHAGCAGIEEGLECPEATQEDLSLVSEDALALRGLRRLPQSLPSAIERFQENETVKGWFGQEFTEVYLLHKAGEMAYLKDRSEQDIAAAYETAY